MTTLKRAHQELFRRTPDECFSTLDALTAHCRQTRENSQDRWHTPGSVRIESNSGKVVTALGDDGAFTLNDWSFSQLCRFAGVSKDTVNRLSSDTASQVFRETLPQNGDKPMQFLTAGQRDLRSLHGTQYTRLWNADLLDVIGEFASDFSPPQKAANGEGTGLYCGEQDLFAFLIDPTGWAEIDGEAFAPGFFVWNSEVGRRSLGIQTFWFQSVCQNHIVWDAVEVVEFTRKHTANVADGLTEIRRIIETLVAKRDARRDGFAEVIRKAMETRLGDDADEAMKALTKHGITRAMGSKALEIARQQGAFTIFALVDALTRLTQQVAYIGDRSEIDQKIGALLALAA